MATLDELVAAGGLVRIEADLEASEQNERLIYAHPRVVMWAEETLPELRSEIHDVIAPIEQLETLISSFIRGDDLAEVIQFRKMRPVDRHIWELKTSDLRIFGWFYRKSIFIASSIDDASRVKDLRLYPGYRDQAVRDRDFLLLDPPTCIESLDPYHVL